MEKGLRCTMCGTAEWEWDSKQGGRQGAYEVIEHHCRGCAAIAGMQKGQDPNRNTDGITYQLERTGTLDSAERNVRARRFALRDRELSRREREEA